MADLSRPQELAAYKAVRGETWQPGKPAFANARGKRWTRNAIAQHVIPPALEVANRQRAEAGLPAIRDEVTPHTLRYTCTASLFAAGADQEYVAAQVGHEDVTTTSASTAMCCSGAGAASRPAASTGDARVRRGRGAGRRATGAGAR